MALHEQDQTFLTELCNSLVFVFQGQWKHKFDKQNVMKSDFYVSATYKCLVPMMYQERKFKYARIDGDKVKILELPYIGADITMVLILPTEGTSLPEVSWL